MVAEVVYLFFGPPTFNSEVRPNHEALQIVAGISAILGHNFTCWLGFKGGKGVATALGALLVLSPVVALAATVLFAGLFGATRRVSVGSLGAAVATPVALVLGHAPRAHVIGMLVVGLLILLRHRENIARLVEGTEPRFGQHKN